MEPAEELRRVRALHELQILDTPREERFDRVVRLAQRLFDVPTAAINLIDEDRQWGKAVAGGLTTDCPRQDAVCASTISEPRALVVEDLTDDGRFSSFPAVADGLRFYAGQPLSAPGGERVGALCIVDDKPRELSESDLALLRDLADLVEKELAVSGEIARAGEVQRQLLPRTPPDVPGYAFAGSCRPTHEVGGDFFDWYTVNDGSPQLTVADVMGKGVSAALVAATVRAMLRGATHFNGVAEAVNRAAFALEPDLDETGSFVTLFTARLDPPSGTLTYVDAGHGLSVVIDRHGHTRRLVSDGLPLGTMTLEPLSGQTAHLAPGDTLLSVSDGYLDFFAGLDEAIAAAVRASGEASSAHALVERMVEFTDGQTPLDDITVVVVRRDST